MTLHFRDRRGFAPSDIEPKSSLSVNRSPIRYDFCGGAKAIRYSVKIALISKTTTLRVHDTFWYISLPSLHHYDVKLPNLKFYGELKQMAKNLNMEKVGIMSTKIERTPINFVRGVFPDVAVVVS